MKVRDIMKRDPVVVKEAMLVRDVLRTMVANKVTGVSVVDDEGTLLGFIPEVNLIVRSLVGAGRILPEKTAHVDHREFVQLQRQIYGKTAREIMNREVVTVDESADVLEALQHMLDNRVSRLPVVRRGKVVGDLSRTTLLRTLLEFEEDQHARHSSDRGPTDEEITRRVNEAIHHQMRVSPGNIRLRVSQGTVYLQGMVAALDDIAAMQDLAENVPGVKDVVNCLLVEQLLA